MALAYAPATSPILLTLTSCFLKLRLRFAIGYFKKARNSLIAHHVFSTPIDPSSVVVTVFALFCFFFFFKPASNKVREIDCTL